MSDAHIVITLSLAAAAAYGGSDFVGGVLARRTSVGPHLIASG